VPLHVPTVAQADAACASCHAEIYQRYLKTAMASASGDATDALVPGTFSHKPSGVSYTVGIDHGRGYLAYQRDGQQQMDGRVNLDFYVGSGHRGRTYLFHAEDWWFEAPINFYRGLYRGAGAGSGGYDMAPNFLDVRQMPLNLPVDSGCLHCHASGVQMQQPGSRNRYAGLPFTQGGITCEACHGDGAAHVASGGKAAVLDPSKLAPDRRDAVCYRCHLEGEVNVHAAGRSPAEFRPGDRLEKYVTYFVHSGSTATTARAVSQVEALNLSGCKRAAGDRMTCTTCHDPHGDPAPGERAAFYRARCTQCHSQQKYVSATAQHAHHAEQPDCTACHMPRIATDAIAHTQGTDHRIPPRKGEYETAALQLTTLGGPQQTSLQPVPGTTASARDLAVATFELISMGDLAAAPAAETLLRQAQKANPQDAEVLSDLGWLAQRRNSRKEAAQLYAEALRQDPLSISANTNYGVLLAQAGQLVEAARLWNAVERQNPGIAELGYDLGVVECSLGNRPAAQRILERLLSFQPDDPQARKLLAEVASGKRDCGERTKK